MQAAQDITIGGAAVQDPVSIYAGRCRSRRAQPLGGDLPRQAARHLPGITDVASDQPMPARCSTSPSTARSPRASASCRRRSTTRSTTPSASASSRRCSPTLNQYHVVLEVDPQFQFGPKRSSGIYVNSSERPAGAAEPRLVNSVDQGGADRGQPSGPVPVGDASRSTCRPALRSARR